MIKHIINWALITVAIFVTAEIVPGIEVSNFLVAFIVAVALGVINVFLKPIFMILTLPINILSLGLFTLVINASLVMLTGKIVDGFEVSSFWWALIFSLVLSLVHFVLHRVGKK
jgi:putative membrane protein